MTMLASNPSPMLARMEWLSLVSLSPRRALMTTEQVHLRMVMAPSAGTLTTLTVVMRKRDQRVLRTCLTSLMATGFLQRGRGGSSAFCWHGPGQWTAIRTWL